MVRIAYMEYFCTFAVEMFRSIPINQTNQKHIILWTF